MHSTRHLAYLTGTLFLLQLLPYFLAHEYLLGSLLYADDFLVQIQDHPAQAGVALVLELLSAFAFVGFSAIFYQLLKGVFPTLSLLYLGTRLVEFGLIVLSEVKLMALASLAELATEAPATEAGLYAKLGTVLLSEWEWTTLIYMVIFCINALLFYGLLFQTRLLPRFVAI